MSRFRLATTDRWTPGWTPTRALCPGALALTCAVLAATPVSAAPQIVQEYPAQTEYTIQSLPVDVALTPNGRRAAVRSANPATNTDGITFFDLSLSPLPAGPIASFPAGGYGTSMATAPTYMPSDRIALTNTRGVAIGSGSLVAGTMCQTYIDVFDASATPGLIQSHVFGGLDTQLPWEMAGYAHDVEITPDGSYGIVNSANWIHIVDVGNGNVTAINIGGPGFGPNGGPYPCNPDQAVDSVAVTNDFAVVTTARYQSVPSTTGLRWVAWVYIVDLNRKSVVLEHQMLPPPGTPVGVNATLRPHDLAITRDGRLAVVTCDRMIGLFELSSQTCVATHYDAHSARGYQLQVDSVEVTNNRAVIIADRMYWPPPGGVPFWQVEVWGIDATTGLTQLASYVDQSWPNGTISRAHDLAIAPGDTKAVVRTSRDNVIINDLVNPPAAPVVLQSPNSSNAYMFQGYPAPTVFSSDSVVIGPLVNGAQIAVTIGGGPIGGGLLGGFADFIDLAPSQPTLSQVAIVSYEPTPTIGCVPVDLSLSRDSSHVVIRSADKYADVSAGVPSSPGADVVFMPLTAVSSIDASFGGSGTVLALDSIVVGTDVGGLYGRTRAVSVSQDPNTNTGRVHIVDL
ncbi:MAG: hypothetical protein Q8K63_10585 [Acidimicrobiales bacterium]|nr:hypothetical protein [Acidimicrobiales bacterium]